MDILQIKQTFIGMESAPCPLTDRLVKAGYQQLGGGYIDRAKREGVVVDYRQCSPSQYWHLMTYCDSKSPNDKFQSVVCGELIFWMAEVLGCVEQQEMEKLLNDIIDSATPSEKRPIYDRRKWNKRIHELCYDKIVASVTGEPTSSNSGNNVLNGVRKQVKKIGRKSLKFKDADISVMYGCPEVLFSPKKKAEKRLREKGEDFNAE